ncbi:lipopolysaccharide biosynthesis protein [Arthrobacter globiformis]|uniref:lipopolysaccharide biosynthesis protein n=1 Tax=Arthrobacter globiformis TaxID=1665 RepID=UPI0011B94163|nr:hypothetical protein [Arthrobacter globiformis]
MSKLYSQLLKVGALRLAGLAIGFVTSFYAARLLIDAFGPSGYGAIATIISLPALLPFADLGFGNAVVNSYAANQPRSREVLRIAVAVTGVAAVGLIIASSALFYSGFLGEALGPAVMGSVANADSAAYGILLLTWLTVPLGLAYRLVQGQGRLDVAMAWQLLVPPISILALLLFLGPLKELEVAPTYLAVATVIVSACFFATSVLPKLNWSRNFAASWKVHFPLVLRSGWPSLLISLMLAISFQSGRIFLSHFSTPDQVVAYSFGLLLYAPVSALFSVSAQHLWSHYAKERATRSMTGQLLISNVRLYAGVSVLGFVGLALCGNWIISTFVYADSHLGSLFTVFGLMLVVQAAHLPAAMFLTSPEHLRWQARLLGLCSLLTIALSLGLSPSLGAVGIVVAGTVPVALVQFPVTLRKALRVIAEC